jgi:hypothetical protein
VAEQAVAEPDRSSSAILVRRLEFDGDGFTDESLRKDFS